MIAFSFCGFSNEFSQRELTYYLYFTKMDPFTGDSPCFVWPVENLGAPIPGSIDGTGAIVLMAPLLLFSRVGRMGPGR